MSCNNCDNCKSLPTEKKYGKMSMKGRDTKMDEKIPLAGEMYGDLKKEMKFQKGLIVGLLVALFVSNMYHIYQWSQFDTVVVDSGDGYGHANYVQGDNSGGIYNGESGSTPTEEWTEPGSTD